MKKLRTSYAKPGLLRKVKKIDRTSSEKSRVKEKPKKLAWTSSETFRDPCWRCSASRGYLEKCEMSNGLGPPKGRCWVSLFWKRGRPECRRFSSAIYGHEGAKQMALARRVAEQGPDE